MFGVISIKYDETHRIIAFSVSYFHNAHIYTYTIMRICASQLSAAFFYFAVNATQTAYNFQSWSFKNTPSSRQVETCSSASLFFCCQKSSFLPLPTSKAARSSQLCISYFHYSCFSHRLMNTSRTTSAAVCSSLPTRFRFIALRQF